jgi:hypothetical protein
VVIIGAWWALNIGKEVVYYSEQRTRAYVTFKDTNPRKEEETLK